MASAAAGSFIGGLSAAPCVATCYAVISFLTKLGHEESELHR